MIGLVMVVRDEEKVIGRCLHSVRDLIDHWTICDTGSTDRTPELVEELLSGIPGKLHRHKWRNYGENSTLALRAARGTAEWLLRLDADCTVRHHPGLRDFLDGYSEPMDAWMVEIEDHGHRWRLPWLVRGDVEWWYKGMVHEYLDLNGHRKRFLDGITVHHHGDGAHQEGKLERWLELLRPGFEDGDPRDTFYFAETLRYLGRTERAVEAHRIRARMDTGFEEERWYSTYQAARLTGDVPGLLVAWAARPWRHEPLSEAARLVHADGPRDDLLFHEPLDFRPKF